MSDNAAMDELPVRASDAERDQTVALLRRHSVSGRLTLEEFAHRMDLAFAARTRTELEALTDDLPAEGQPRRRRRAKWLTAVVFGSTERKGRWRLPRFALLGVLFGDAQASPFAASMQAGMGSVEELSAEVERKYKAELSPKL